jgi:diaminopimelate decarboxylase
MDHFDYREGQLHAENVAIDFIADAVGTPFYCYSTATLERHFNAYTDAFSNLNATVCYAVKANSNIAVIATLARLPSEVAYQRTRLCFPVSVSLEMKLSPL